MIGNIHKNQSITSFFNVASLNINNHIKFSLNFVHRGTVVFLRDFGPFSNRRPFQRLHTRVCNRTGLCLQKKIIHRSPWGSHLEMKEATFLRSRISGNYVSPTLIFLTCEKVVFVGLLTSVCGLCWTSDFCVWSLLETKACSVKHTSVEALKRSLGREWVKIP